MVLTEGLLLFLAPAMVTELAIDLAGVVFYTFSAVGSAVTLWTRSVSDPSILGIRLAVASLSIMPIIAKKHVSTAIGSEALNAEGNCTWVLAYMSATLVVGLLVTKVLGWWWADRVAARIAPDVHHKIDK